LVEEHDDRDGLTALSGPAGRLWVHRLDRPSGARVRVRVLARDVSLALGKEGAGTILNVLQGEVAEVAKVATGQVLVRVACGAEARRADVVARITARSCRELGLLPGSRVFARVKSVSLAEF
jgi:molybdate transport system ATP-binding protein